ncbi:hypothetical protein KGF54_002534 [Candida jiufengensis]|uniref:uncharacterized protein n=1 Tax=Candida jiufengensis TaxID=497108 RepID=UPI002224925C|nr:uncharacterized protein KGF54_002534 [Candida jiufengensis]KAI5953163.1 hypothetical protein KGF54_002534 [Candida jiufengensis]
MSRRQRLLELAKNTRENYVSKISTSVGSIASNASRVFIANPEKYDEDGNIILPKDTTIQLYPTYTRRQRDKYLVDVSGLVFAPGIANRRNRFIIAAFKRAIDKEVADQDLVELETDKHFNQETFDASNPQGSDTESISSSESNVSTTYSNNNNNNSPIIQDRIRERLAGFLAKSVANAHLIITIGAANNFERNLTEQEIFTDKNGNFDTTIEVNYEPSIIVAKSVIDDTIFKISEVMFIPNKGVGIISDIDDTIKHTGVVGSRKILMRNLLTGTFDSWTIKNIINWYKDIYSKSGVNFFYVSNSPWQLYDCIYEYMNKVQLPIGSIHLKKYLGNIMSIILEPSLSRKRKILDKILTDFPEKKFVCIGDSGEVDLEAYTYIAAKYTNQVSAIYIRIVGPLSEFDDSQILDQLVYLVNTRNNRKPIPEKEEDQQDQKIDEEEVNDLIDLSDSPPPIKYAPVKPIKPSKLKSFKVNNSPLTLHNSTPIDKEKISTTPTSSNIASDGSPITEESISTPPLPPRRRKTMDEEDLNLLSILDTQNFKDLEIYDNKGSKWIRRIIEALILLKDTNTVIEFFMDDDFEFFEKSSKFIDDIQN